MQDEKNIAAGLPDVLTVPEFAEYLRLHEWTVYEAIKRDEIPGVIRLGRAIRLHRATVMEWLQSGGSVK